MNLIDSTGSFGLSGSSGPGGSPKKSVLTLGQRLEIYRKLKKLYEERDPNVFNRKEYVNKVQTNRRTETVEKTYYNLCATMSDNFLDGYAVSWSNYPELLAQEPKKGWARNDAYWWSPFSWVPRLRAIDRAIELTEEKIREENAKNQQQ